MSRLLLLLEVKKMKLTASQQKAISLRGKNLLVSAGAGSGKTSVMIERIVDLIATNHIPISSFLVVTFTKASASDMKSKLIKKLMEKAEDSFCLEQAELVGTSDVTNLHSFCSRLLKTYFYVVGLDPSFIIIDENEMQKIESRAITKLYSECFSSNDKEMLELLDVFNKKRSDQGLSDIILQLKTFCVTKADYIQFLNDASKLCYDSNLETNICAKIINNQCIHVFGNAKNVYQKYLDMAVSVNDNKMIDYLKSRIILASYIDSKSTIYANYQCLFNLPEVKRMPSKIKDENAFIKEDITKFNKIFNDEINDLKECWGTGDYNELITRQKLNYNRVKTIIRLTQRFLEILEEEKTAKGGVDFNDLEHFTLKLLENEEVVKQLCDKYRYIFVDEYQDINEVQEKIISKLSGNNNRFMVGDIKQSIYRFRHCDPEIFLEKFNQYTQNEEEGEVISLKENFRSHSSILKFVNYVMNDIYTKDFGALDYKTDGQLVSGLGDWKQDKKPVSFSVIDTTNLDKNIEPLSIENVYSVVNHKNEYNEETATAEREAMVVAQKLGDVVGSMRYDNNGENGKIIRFKDVAILLSARGPYLEKFKDALIRLGVPVSTDVTDNVMEDEYVIYLVNLLKLIYNFEDDYALYITLKNPLFNFTPDELAEIRIKAEDNVSFATAFKQSVGNKLISEQLLLKINDFDAQISRFKTMSTFLTVKELAIRIIKETNFDFYVLENVEPALHKGRVETFLENLGDESLSSFVLNYENFNISSSGQASSDSVKIMTIHASKGLEFPVVFLVNCSREFSTKNTQSDILISKDLGLGIKFYDKEKRFKSETLARSACKIIENERNKEEQLRLLYVALTRAENYLYVIETGKLDVLKTSTQPYKAKSFANWFSKIVANSGQGEVANYCDYEVLKAEDFEKFEVKNASTDVIFNKPEEDKILNFRNEANKKYYDQSLLQFSQKSTVTRLNQEHEDDLQLTNTLFIEDEGFDASLGTAYHKILELLDFNTVKTETEINDFIVHSGVMDFEKVDAKIITAINHSPVMQNLAGGKFIKEKEFIMAIDPKTGEVDNSSEFMVVQGVCDLIVIKDEGITIIDYKLTNRNRDALIKTYHKQLELYAKMAEKAYQLPVRKKYIAKLTTAEFIEV